MEQDFNLLDEALEEGSLEVTVFDDAEFKELNSRELEYPCILIHDMESEAEYKFFRDRVLSDTCAGIPLFCELDGVIARVGTIEISLNAMLSLHSIYDYDMELCKAENDSVKLNTGDVNALLKLIQV